MNNMAKFGLAAAVVVVAAPLGFSYFVAPNVGASAAAIRPAPARPRHPLSTAVGARDVPIDDVG